MVRVPNIIILSFHKRELSHDKSGASSRFVEKIATYIFDPCRRLISMEARPIGRNAAATGAGL